MRRALWLLAVLACAGTVGACGGGGDDGLTPAEPTKEMSSTTADDELHEEEQAIPGELGGGEAGRGSYGEGMNICSTFPLEELARQNGVAATPEAVARKVASIKTTRKDKAAIYEGCMDAIKLTQAASGGG